MIVASYLATLIVGIAIGACGLAFWVEMLDPSAPGDGLEKYDGK